MKKIAYLIFILILIAASWLIYKNISKYINENRILKQVVKRLESDSRVAEVLVTDVHYDESTKMTTTTIKFLEYDTDQNPLKPRYFRFSGNIIQFQSLVIRFNDLHIRNKDILKGKSAYLFWKVFLLDGKNTQEYEITSLDGIPDGYRVDKDLNPFEASLWKSFWDYALNPEKSKKMGVKNAQIEAPGTMFLPGTLYTLKIEHDGGIRIDAEPLPTILRGEHIQQ